jgi:hypothetical protein
VMVIGFVSLLGFGPLSLNIFILPPLPVIPASLELWIHLLAIFIGLSLLVMSIASFVHVSVSLLSDSLSSLGFCFLRLGHFVAHLWRF